MYFWLRCPLRSQRKPTPLMMHGLHNSEFHPSEVNTGQATTTAFSRLRELSLSQLPVPHKLHLLPLLDRVFLIKSRHTFTQGRFKSTFNVAPCLLKKSRSREPQHSSLIGVPSTFISKRMLVSHTRTLFQVNVITFCMPCKHIGPNFCLIDDWHVAEIY